jgi:hypothetical protein
MFSMVMQDSVVAGMMCYFSPLESLVAKYLLSSTYIVEN